MPTYKVLDKAELAALANQGGTFHSAQGDPVGLGRIKLWHDVTETHPGGATLLPSETYPVGTLFPAGMPIEVTDNTPGGVAIPDSSTPTGLSEYDRVMGSEGVLFTVVTKGVMYGKRTEATITATQKAALASRINILNA